MKVRRISMLLGIVVCAVLMVTGCVDGAKRTAIAVDEMHLPKQSGFFQLPQRIYTLQASKSVTRQQGRRL